MKTTALRSLLFVPASRPERIPKALSSGADAVIVDLEDAVAPTEKDAARDALTGFLESNPDVGVLVRINAPDGEQFSQDLEVCARHTAVSGIMVPKAETSRALEEAGACEKPVWPLIETPRGVLALPDLARVANIERLTFGALDMSSELGLAPAAKGAQQLLDHCRCQLVLNSHAAGLMGPIESPHPAIDDPEAVEQTARHARELGFAGMLCIHPRQVSPIHQGFAPDEGEIEWARKVVARADRGESVFSIEGQMVDAPVIARARTILARAARHTELSGARASP